MSATWTSLARQRAPGDVVLHPLALVAVVVLVVNDRVLKAQVPGLVTGKLSDIAAMVFCPLLVAGLWEIGRWAVRRTPTPLGVRSSWAVCVLVAAGFATMKTSAPVGQRYGELLGHLRGMLGSGGGAVVVTHDPTDVVAIVFVVLPALVLTARARVGLRQTQV